MNEEELLQRLKQNDPQAMRALVQRFYPSVLRFLYTLCPNPDDAEELTQEAFVKAIRNVKRFRGESTLRTWLHSIAFHEYTRHRRRDRQRVELATEPLTTPFASASLLAIDLERAVARLSEEMRTAFVLCDVQELTMQEASTIVNVPVGTVKSRLHMARKRLQEILEPEPQSKENIHVPTL